MGIGKKDFCMHVLSRSPKRFIPWIYENRLVLIAGLALIFFSIFRTAIHVDEARYLTVAWEMIEGGDYLVPHLNGEPYSHKPPLLFWLTAAVWSLTGVHLWSARLIPILFILLTAIALTPLHRAFFPEEKSTSPLIIQTFFLSNLMILGTSQLFMFDTLMMFWVTLGWLLIEKGRNIPLLLGLVIGLAILTKGPVIFIYLLPILILQGILDPAKRNKKWILQNGLAIIIGSTIGLSWALLAAHHGGEDYAQTLLWKQTANRLINSPYHQRPWWFYGAFIPVLILPGGFLIDWRKIRSKEFWKNKTHQLIGLWILSIFLIFTIVSCKQLQYLIPIVPLICILMTRAYGKECIQEQEELIVANKNLNISLTRNIDNGASSSRTLEALREQRELRASWEPGSRINESAILPASQKIPLPTHPIRPLKILLFCSYFLFGLILYPLDQQMEKRLPLNGIARALTPFPHVPLAFLHSRYHGELGFPLGRTKVDILREARDLKSWFTQNPQGIAILFDSLTFFPGIYHFNWFRSIPQRHTWDYLRELSRFYDDYTILARFPGKYADKIVIQRKI